MTSEQLHTALYEKLSAEFEKYREDLMTLPPSEILNHTYEHTIKQDIVCVMEETEFDDSFVKALLRSPCPLNDIYEEYNTRETQHMDILRDCFEAEAKAAIKRRQERRKSRHRKKNEIVR